jgi:predicted kinase
MAHYKDMDPSHKLLIQMSGAPGSGKSTIAKLLAPPANAVIIDHDLIKSFFLENDISFDQSTQLAYKFQWVLAETVIEQGKNVIMDSTCNHKPVLDRGIALARQYGLDYKYIECNVGTVDTAIELLDQRIRQRVPLRSQRTGVNQPPRDAGARAYHSEGYYGLFKKWIENPVRPAGDNVRIVVDSTGNPEQCQDYILTQIALSPKDSKG